MATFIDLPTDKRRKLIAAASNYTSSTSLTKMTLKAMESDPRVEVDEEYGKINFKATVNVLVQFAVQYPMTSGTAQRLTIQSQVSQNNHYTGDIRHEFSKSTTEYAQVYTSSTNGNYAVYTFNSGDSMYAFNSYYGSSSDKKATCYMFIYIWE